MRASRLELEGLTAIEPIVHADSRGHFYESYHREKFRELGLDLDFVQDNQSRSSRGVLRGLHAQLRQPQGKLVRALAGEIFDVAVDLRPTSATFGRWDSIVLSEDNKLLLWVPPGFAHGFCVLSEVAVVSYKCTAIYDPQDEIGIRWDDRDLAIDWPLENPILSEKDLALPTLAELRPRLEV